MEWFTIIFLVTFLSQNVYPKGMDLQFSWSRINYTWPTNKDILKDIQRDDPNAYDTYIYENCVPMGSNKWKNKAFVSVPRRRAGVPSTLNFVWLNSTQRHNVPLIPYPNWETNRQNTLNDNNIHLVSTYRMVVDECDRLWVIDDGRIESFGSSGKVFQIQNPSIVIFDLHTDKIIRRYFLKDTDLTPLTSTVNLAVDVDRSSCDNAYAYVPDMLGFGVIIYSFKDNDSWRMKHKYYYLEPLSTDLDIAGMRFNWYDGVFSFGLSEKNRDGFRTAYFHVLAGTHQLSVSTEVLRTKALATRSYHGNDLKILFHKGANTHSSSSDLHKSTGVLFFALINQNAVGCWNTNKGKDSSYVDVVFRDDERFIYPSDLKVTNDEIIAMTDQYPIYAYKSFNYNETNFRLWITNVHQAIKNTVCSNDKNQGSYGHFHFPQ